jgi:hypothetical protein
MRPANSKAALRLLQRATAHPPALLLSFPEQVLKELADNQQNIREETRVKIARMNNNLKRISDAYAVHDLPLELNGLDLRVHDFPKMANEFVERIKSAAIQFQPTVETTQKAMVRISQGLAPNHRGNQYKDCVVIESNFELVKILRARGYKEKVVFLTTNVGDYGAERGTIKVHPDLANDFTSLAIEYATNFGLAEHLLGG